MALQIERTIAKNKQRLEDLNAPYDPYTGEGSFSVPRTEVKLPDCPLITTERGTLFLPTDMVESSIVSTLIQLGSVKKYLTSRDIVPNEANVMAFWEEFIELRNKYDFEFWAYSFTFIKHKTLGKNVPFKLNRGQRILLKEMEKMRHSKDGLIRIVLLKARQWGGSTLVQIYFAWFQLVHHVQWNSIIAAHVEKAARNIRGMYTNLLNNYPWTICPEAGCEADVRLTPFEGSQNTRWVKCRGCKVSVNSVERPEGIRSEDVVMAHLSEVGLWKETQGRKPEDLVQSVKGSIMPIRDSIIVYESTAKGVGNYFHKEWLRAVNGESGYCPVFVAWFDNEANQKEIDIDIKEFIRSLTDEEQELFRLGATLEGINWLRVQRAEFTDKWRFYSEFPSTALEAFQSTGNPFFDLDDVNRMRENVIDPKYVGELVGMKPLGEAECLYRIEFNENDRANFKVWKKPDKEEKVTERYVVVVDIGGMSERADRSVICVFDRYWMAYGGVPEVVAEWCGHTEHYKLAWIAAQIATWYHDALLVIESNTLETHRTEGYHGEYILDEIGRHYRNLYARTSEEDVRQGLPTKWGFQTNRITKVTVCDHQKKVLLKDMYIEHCDECVFEHQVLELKEDGTIGAREGCHDDRFITRAIGNYICWEKMSPPEKMRGSQGGVWSGSVLGI